jgi:hypothetical protein
LQGGAGEGKQHLKPDGTIKNSKEVKTDAALPAYCNPPNPCPVGYTVDDGCLEQFDNTAGFSREYQAAQDCMCDSEHMFDCPSSIGRVLQSPGDGNDISDSDLDRIMEQIQVATPLSTFTIHLRRYKTYNQFFLLEKNTKCHLMFLGFRRRLDSSVDASNLQP